MALTRGRFEVIASPQMLDELDRVLARSKFRRYASLEEARVFVDVVARLAILIDDPPAIPGATADPADDYLVALARAANADALVSGDRHLLALPDHHPPILTPRAFLNQVDASTP